MQGAELDDLSASKSLGRDLWKDLFSASISSLEQRDGGKEKKSVLGVSQFSWKTTTSQL